MQKKHQLIRYFDKQQTNVTTLSFFSPLLVICLILHNRDALTS